MKTEEIIDNNKLIAEFMGWTRSPFDHLPNRMYNDDLQAGHSLGRDAITMKYNTSWDELIPVVKKIQQISIENFSIKKPVMSALIDVDIELLYLAVVVFILRYNAEPKPR